MKVDDLGKTRLHSTLGRACFARALTFGLSLQLGPSRLAISSDPKSRYAVYVEPPRAPGLGEVIPVLKGKVAHAHEPDRSTSDYAPLAGNGLQDDRATRITTEAGEGGDPVVHAHYRLIATRDLEPIGYCTLSVLLAPRFGCELQIDEIWLDRPYRGVGLGSAMASRAAQITVNSLVQVDRRLDILGATPFALPLTVVGDVYSTSGARFIDSLANVIRLTIRIEEWAVLRVRKVDVQTCW